jgi:hypothetical protein
VSLKLLAKASTDALLQTGVYGLQQKVAKLCREGGTVKFTTMAGTELTGDVLTASMTPEVLPELYSPCSPWCWG